MLYSIVQSLSLISLRRVCQEFIEKLPASYLTFIYVSCTALYFIDINFSAVFLFICLVLSVFYSFIIIFCPLLLYCLLAHVYSLFHTIARFYFFYKYIFINCPLTWRCDSIMWTLFLLERRSSYSNFTPVLLYILSVLMSQTPVLYIVLVLNKYYKTLNF